MISIKSFRQISLTLLMLSTPSAFADNFAGMTLQDVYALPQARLEALLLQDKKETCDSLISAITLEQDKMGLTAAQFCAIQDYSGGGYFVNRGLWKTDATGSALSGAEWAYVRVLDSALAKLHNEAPTIVYRGTTTREVKFTSPGQVVRLKGYSSTSPNREVAEGFIKDRLMIIRAISGKNIKAYSNAGMEDEFLLPRSTLVRFDRSEIQDMEIFTEEGPEVRKVEVVYLTEVKK